MAALALFFQRLGVSISGSDIPDVFYTDELLRTAGITWDEHFSAANIPDKTDMVVYSAAYSKESNEELAFALEKYPCHSYPHMLGWVSAQQESWAVIGTHGKTSTAALMGALCRSQRYPVMGLTGAKVADFGDNTFFVDGRELFLAEVCEYRGHFMNFSPSHIVFLNAEWDHTDYFRDSEAVYQEFAEFILKLAPQGKVIACVSDLGVRKTLDMVVEKRSDICIVPYRVDDSLDSAPLDGAPDGAPAALDGALYRGKPVVSLYDYQRIEEQGVMLQSCRIKNLSFASGGDHSSGDHSSGDRSSGDRSSGDRSSGDHSSGDHSSDDRSSDGDSVVWKLRTPAKPLLWNTVAALLCIKELSEKFGHEDVEALQSCLLEFGTLSRRSELLYQNDSITIVDDYAHHPRAIEVTLESLRQHYQPKRCIVDFMSHTYTRTQAFWDEFAHCFQDADVLIINDIYSSAREKEELQKKQDSSGGQDVNAAPQISSAPQMPSGETLAQHIGEQQANVCHISSFQESADYIHSIVQKDDLVVTMGAGDNFRVAEHLIAHLEGGQG